MNRIKFLREAKGIRQVDLAVKLNVSQGTLSNWERNVHDPDTASLVLLSKLLDVDVNAVLGVPESSHDGAIRVPVLGSIPAGIPIEAIEDVLDYEEVPADWGRGGKEFFALKIRGDSMFPKYVDSDIVIFEKSPNCDSGKDCALIVNGDDATFKKLIKNINGIVLQPINTDYEPLFFSNSEVEELPVSVIGVAREIRRTL